MTLRLATKEDYGDILRMAKNFHRESPYSSLEFSEDASKELFEQYLAGDKTRLIIIVSEMDSKPRGMVIGLSSSPLFSRDKMSTEIAWWMDHEYRKTRDSLLLISAYEDWSKRVGSKITQVAMLDDVTDLSSFYRKHGFKQAERSFIKEV